MEEHSSACLKKLIEQKTEIEVYEHHFETFDWETITNKHMIVGYDRCRCHAHFQFRYYDTDRKLIVVDYDQCVVNSIERYDIFDEISYNIINYNFCLKD